MPFTLAGAPIETALVRVPRFHAWTADVAVAGPLQLAPGARATLQIGDLVLVGTVLAGGTYAQQSTYTLVGGAGRWRATVPKKPHRSDAGVTVAEVARDLATDTRATPNDAATGERVVLEASAERPLGYAWERAAGVAADALEQLVGDAWWIAADGMTHLGPRPVRPIAPATLHVTAYEAALRRATVSLDDDAVAQLLPGAVLSADGLPAPLVVGGTTIRVTGQAVEVDLLGERPASEMVSALLALLAARARVGAPQLYQVTEDAAGRTSGRAAGPAAASLPDQQWIDRVFGVPGVTADLQPGALVLVGLLDGSPGAPRVLGYLPGVLPLSVTLDAMTDVKIGGAGAVPLSKAPATDASIAALVTAHNALCTATGHAGLAVSIQPSTACTKAKGA